MNIIWKCRRKSRALIQAMFTVLTNGYLIGFTQGKIYQGNMKYVCVPGLNCYSCPGAVGSCPLGSLQSMLTGSSKSVPYYVLGSLMLVGVIFGRIVCGFLCPFGFVQDLLYRIRSKKVELPKKIDGKLRYLKYVIGLVFVIILPLVLTNQFGISSPYFCKWICPSGTLFGSVPLLSANETLRANIGILFNWKMFLLLFFLLTSVFTYRPFCKYICPLGAFYGIFNRFSFYQMSVDKSRCTDCKLCETHCKMGVKITENINSSECIRCGECKDVCPQNCIASKVELMEQKK